MLNKQIGNMYDFVTHTWNPIKGKCMHDCKYCYMKKWGEQKPLRLDENELKTNLGSGNFIFVGSGTDMFARNVPTMYILDVLIHCKKYPDNTYLFQSKNPEVFLFFKFPTNSIFGTTIESNRDYPEISKAPKIQDRVDGMIKLKKMGFRLMITIEPVLNFDVNRLVKIIEIIKPEWINLGADSGGHNLPEPSKEKLLELISRIKIRQKKNLKRLLK
ncbi:MAG: hypothetical protein QQN41_10160 [Nitrosopumilus sp.]